MTVSDSLKYAEDMTNAVDCLLAQNRKQINYVAITNDAINYDDTNINKTTIISRLTIADGYRSYAPYDGYLNPGFEQISAENTVLSAGQLTDNLFLIGPFVFPYELNGVSGGVDPYLFQPSIGSNNNIQIYLQIFGLGLSPQGNFYKIKEIKLSGKGIQAGISYKLLIQSTQSNPLL